jgi:hypothetical protein
VVKIEHSELAMENELAQQVRVVDMTAGGRDQEQDLPDLHYG